MKKILKIHYFLIYSNGIDSNKNYAFIVVIYLSSIN